ncbi:MAG: hypothetical protein Q4C95_02790 [Planctomycetia bacterium]|nr:hypothetical protein [Planctomycetia bacterium]
MPQSTSITQRVFSFPYYNKQNSSFQASRRQGIENIFGIFSKSILISLGVMNVCRV